MYVVRNEQKLLTSVLMLEPPFVNNCLAPVLLAIAKAFLRYPVEIYADPPQGLEVKLAMAACKYLKVKNKQSDGMNYLTPPKKYQVSNMKAKLFTFKYESLSISNELIYILIHETFS